TPLLFFYHRPAAQALECARLFNDAAREICARAPRRLKSLCQVPLQDTDLACRELTRAMADGHVGVHIGNHVGTRDLNDEGLITFLEHCAGEGAAVFEESDESLVVQVARAHVVADVRSEEHTSELQSPYD